MPTFLPDRAILAEARAALGFTQIARSRFRAALPTGKYGDTILISPGISSNWGRSSGLFHARRRLVNISSLKTRRHYTEFEERGVVAVQ